MSTTWTAPPLTATFDQLVVLSHLRWDSVWQRPHHLVSRIGRHCDTVVVEEPVAAPEVARPGWQQRHHSGVSRLWWQEPGDGAHRGFDSGCAERYAAELTRLVGPASKRVVWLYTPLALPAAEALAPDVLVFDVMDDLASFHGASPRHRDFHRAALERADVVFAGGRSLHAGVVDAGRRDAHCLPSGVEPEHFAAARSLRRPRSRPVAGYVGVIDERLDLDLLAAVADVMTDWDLHLVGPVVKIDPESLPQRPNLYWLGPRDYAELPQVMAGFDVGLMPFALNEATRSISPTKTLEYLAAGLPVVTTPVPDVVADFADATLVAHDAAGFADACRQAVEQRGGLRDLAAERLVRRRTWDAIAADMATCVESTLAAAVAGR